MEIGNKSYFFQKKRKTRALTQNTDIHSLKIFIFQYLLEITTKVPQKELQQLLSAGVALTIGL